MTRCLMTVLVMTVLKVLKVLPLIIIKEDPTACFMPNNLNVKEVSAAFWQIKILSATGCLSVGFHLSKLTIVRSICNHVGSHISVVNMLRKIKMKIVYAILMMLMKNSLKFLNYDHWTFKRYATFNITYSFRSRNAKRLTGYLPVLRDCLYYMAIYL